MKLYDINQQLERLLELDTERMVDTETGEILTVEQLDALLMERAQKIEGCLLLIKNKEAEAAGIDAELKRLDERKKALMNKAKWVRQYVQNCLHGEKFSTPKVSVTYRQSESVEVSCDPQKLPPEYCKTKIEYTADKTALKKALKDGAEIAGVQIITKQNMTIK